MTNQDAQIVNGIDNSQGPNQLQADLWSLDTKFVPTVVNGDRIKKRDLTGAVWSPVEYRIKINGTLLESVDAKH